MKNCLNRIHRCPCRFNLNPASFPQISMLSVPLGILSFYLILKFYGLPSMFPGPQQQCQCHMGAC